MHSTFSGNRMHSHVFDEGNPLAERNTLWATVLEVMQQGQIKVEVIDLHVWRVGKRKYACVLSLITPTDVGPDYFKHPLSVHEELAHVTIEINQHEAR